MEELLLKEYLDINSLIHEYPQFSKNQLRWLIANKEKYKLTKVIKRVGRKIYFNVRGFKLWIDDQSA